MGACFFEDLPGQKQFAANAAEEHRRAMPGRVDNLSAAGEFFVAKNDAM